MTRTNMRAEKLYKEKMTLSSILWLLAGLGVLGFGIYYMEIFELVGGSLLILFSLIQFAGKNRSRKTKHLVKRERDKLKYLCLEIIAFSLINPIGVLPALYDLYKRDWVMRGGLDE
ncbi:MAG: hypothetical protein SOW41_00805 [Anaerococcus sp.]|nr:hypothetical protein [Peptoniphilaceae bacterium]MDY3054581.1 hypothetical protein [Anaerococcus sp.]